MNGFRIEVLFGFLKYDHQPSILGFVKRIFGEQLCDSYHDLSFRCFDVGLLRLITVVNHYTQVLILRVGEELR